MHLAGVDIGTVSSKAVIIDGHEIISSCIIPSGGDYRLSAENVMKEALKGAKLSMDDIRHVVATGYGAANVPFPSQEASDITCDGRAVSFLIPSVRTVVDIGALFSKAFRLDQSGTVAKFVFSGKCAGGCAKILQVIARVLQVKLEEIGALSLKSQKRVEFNTGCAVFMESEAVSRVAEGASKEDLLAGVHRALASQIHSLAERAGIEKDYALIGGGAKNIGLVKAVEETADLEIIVPEKPQLMAALGAALIAGDSLQKK